MNDKNVITGEDLRLAKIDWLIEMAANLRNIRREPVNADPYAQAHLMNLFFRKVIE